MNSREVARCTLCLALLLAGACEGKSAGGAGGAGGLAGGAAGGTAGAPSGQDGGARDAPGRDAPGRADARPGDAAGMAPDARPASCAGVACSGHGMCVEGPVHCQCEMGYVAAGLTCVMSVVPMTGDLFVDLPDTGFASAVLHPTEAAPMGSAIVVSFGVPFPRGTVADAGRIRVTDEAGTEIPAHVEELARWRSLGGAAGFQESTRSALVQISVTFASASPKTIRVHWGAAPGSPLPRMGDPWAGWDAIGAGTFFPAEYPAAAAVREPNVYVTFAPDWLGACILRTRTEPLGTDAGWAFFDGVAPEFARTAVNDVDPRVTAANQINYAGDKEPWLFQRASTLFGMYVRSGDVKWLRHAHRAAQFYAAHLTATGFFDLAADDLKYAYGSALFLDLMLLGDTRQLPRIEAVAGAGAGWNPTYTATTSFWTERHQTYSLLAALVAWEATGSATHAARVTRVATESFRMAREPASGWAPEGCILHTQASHEGDDVTQPICSPWMSALLAEAIFRYYVHSEDRAALEFLAGLADFVRTTGSAADGAGLSPYYLVSSVIHDDPDIEHACDVAGLVARGAWSRTALGGDAAALLATTRGLLTNCAANLEDWHRPGGPAAGLAEWRLSPPRKVNWWFGTTLDLPWLVPAP